MLCSTMRPSFDCPRQGEKRMPSICCQPAGRSSAVKALRGRITRWRPAPVTLAAPTYTHFTSPIRRYPDLVLHRQLAGLVSGEGGALPIPYLKETAAQVESLLDESIQASRTLATEISPLVLHDRGLLPALEWLARWVAWPAH